MTTSMFESIQKRHAARLEELKGLYALLCPFNNASHAELTSMLLIFASRGYAEAANLLAQYESGLDEPTGSHAMQDVQVQIGRVYAQMTVNEIWARETGDKLAI